jgi:hypothetical protein
VPKEKNSSNEIGYLVTAKHVLINEQNQFHEKVVIRLNNKNGGFSLYPINFEHYSIFIHTDDDVDIAVIPFSLNSSIIYISFIPAETFLTKDKITKAKIREGCDVFFSTFFNSYLGKERNEPIFRFGKLSLMPKNKIIYQINQNSNPKLMDLYLVECLSFGGNSGSPAFFNQRFGQTYFTYFAGVVIGSFHNTEIFAVDTFLKQNVGIAAIVPVYKLIDILYSEEAIKHRQLILDF